METTVDTFRPTTTGWLIGTLAGWGTILLAVAGFALTVIGYGPYFLGLTLLALLILAWRWLENMSVKYEVTEQRLIVRRGIVSKSIDEVELFRIKDIRCDFSLINQIAGIGRISIASSDETTRGGDLLLSGIGQVQQRRETLRRLVDAARQKRQVREIDMAHENIG